MQHGNGCPCCKSKSCLYSSSLDSYPINSFITSTLVHEQIKEVPEYILAPKSESKKNPDTWSQINYKEDDFPRFKYHCNLLRKILDQDQERNNPGQFNSTLSTILVYGRITESILALLHPLTLDKDVEIESLNTNVIKLLFSDNINDEYGTLSPSQKKNFKSCSWCIIVSSDQDLDTLRKVFYSNGIDNVSIVPPDVDALWNTLTSAVELPLLDFLKEQREKTHTSERVREDIETVISRIERCSEFPKVKSQHEKPTIPTKIKDVLKRFSEDIVRYGFYSDHFRVVAKDEHYEKVKQALTENRLHGFKEITVIRQSDLHENVTPYCGGLLAQGRKLYMSPEPPIAFESLKDHYGTLGCLALLKKRDSPQQAVALSCKHVCMLNETVYIEDGQTERKALGRCVYTSPGPISIQNDFAIVEVDPAIERLLSRKKLIDQAGIPTKAQVCEENLELIEEIVHKLGASTQWTTGKVVRSEIIGNTQGIIAVKGMNGEVFGKHGDSGSIVFRKRFFGKEQILEVVALLTYGEYEDQKQMTEEKSSDDATKKLIFCSVFKDAFEELKKTNRNIQSISLYNEDTS